MLLFSPDSQKGREFRLCLVERLHVDVHNSARTRCSVRLRANALDRQCCGKCRCLGGYVSLRPLARHFSGRITPLSAHGLVLTLLPVLLALTDLAEHDRFRASQRHPEDMKPLALSPLRALPLTWTCRQCLQSQRRQVSSRSSTYAPPSRRAPRRRPRIGVVVLAAAGGSFGVGALAFTDDVKHAYAAVQRTGRVVSTLAVCINE